MKRFPRGSEWRKWDLHVHVPGTKLNDGYSEIDGKPVFEHFAEILEESDVAVFGITDYFSAEQSLAFIDFFKEKYPKSEKLLLVNVELRLNETVSGDRQMVDFHIIFRDSIPDEKIKMFLALLKTQITDVKDRLKFCSELENRDYLSATVTRADIRQAFVDTFGDKAEPSDYLIYMTPANNNGLRAEPGVRRKANLADEIDKVVHAIFGKDPKNSSYFLRTDRYEDKSQVAKAKPVFGGCDAHNFTDLANWLGRTLESEDTRQVATWVKADPTFEGLQQTLVEPSERVKIQALEPDQKEPYKVISKVKFSGTKDLPSEVLFNGNLNAIIGSRSSGKSALLAYIAHAIDPKGTVKAQSEALGSSSPKESELGPAAGWTWDQVSGMECEVEWKSGQGTVGKVIYIPQNSLYRLSEQPDEITRKITPALFRISPAFKVAYDNAINMIDAANSEIRSAVEEWFDLADRKDKLASEIQNLGDKVAVRAERDRLQSEIDRIKASANLTDTEVDKYQSIAQELGNKDARLIEVELELGQLASYVTLSDEKVPAATRPQAVQVSINVRPSDAEVPEFVATIIDQIKAEASKDLVKKVEAALRKATLRLENEQAVLLADVQKIKEDNKALIAKHEANKELSSVVAEHKKRASQLESIAKLEKTRDRVIEDQKAAVGKVSQGILDRDATLATLVETFDSGERRLTDLKFGIEIQVSAEAVEHITLGFNRGSTNEYIQHKGDPFDYTRAHADPAEFLDSLRDAKVTLNKGYKKNTVAVDVLTVTKEVRFFAELDSDRIGGFGKSSMTPGKQALFALSLILNESQEPWPLLIDQPEDDLDSRSIYDTIVPYLVARKKERQIIMVSHNANLVVGADCEEVIVANRHGDDRKNTDARTFEYLTGAMEHSQELSSASPTALGRFGIREHACEILDGGEEAFQKRRNKYKI